MKSILVCALFTVSFGTLDAGAQMTQSQIHNKIVADLNVVDAPSLKSYVADIVTRLNEGRPNSRIPEITIIDDATVNAFTIGDEYIYFYTGLLAVMESEAELAMVVGHELAHGDRRHPSQNSMESFVGQLVALRAARRAKGPISSVLAARMGQKAGLQCSPRMQERSADYYGLKYLAAGGYKTEEGVKGIARLNSQVTPGLWQRSHPLSQERYAVLSELASKEPGGDYFGREAYQMLVHSHPLVAPLRTSSD